MKRMKTKLVALLAGVGLMAAMLIGPAFANGGNNGFPSPTDPNCHGKIISYIAQHGGLGNVAPGHVQDLQQFVKYYCNLDK